jgi:hypothetical protein
LFLAKKASYKKFNIASPLTTFIGHTALFVSRFPSTNSAIIAPELNLKTSVILDDGVHNGFPDLIYWQRSFYLAFRVAKSHLDHHSSIKIFRSSDAKKWEPIAQMGFENEDLRDPKFALINGELFLYVLKNKDLGEMPYTTIFSTSKDGVNWSQWCDVSPANWVFWRPKTNDGRLWYVAADDRKMKQSALFSSIDGINWDKISTIYSGEFHAEIELAFLANKDILSTVRVEGIEGHPRTIIAHASYPYKTWGLASSYLTRLDGAASFAYHGQVFSAGRFEPKPISRMGNFLNKKRTSLFLVQPNEIIWLSDLPSSGDTGYASVVVLENTAFVVYYTSDPHKDNPWIIGQFNPTQIRMAQIDLNKLELLSNRR